MAKKKSLNENPADDAAPSTFEGALAELSEIVDELEDGERGLEDSLKRFERGIGLLRECYQLLERAEQRIEQLTGFDAQGQPVTRPFDGTATLQGWTEEKGTSWGGAPESQSGPSTNVSEPERTADGQLFQ